jgi:putative sterol carrier protein
VADPTAVFFDDLARRGHEPLLGDAVGSVRIELAGDSLAGTWLVRLDQGEITVSRDEVAADCVVRCDRSVFDGIAAGEVNAVAALLRGALVYEGDPELLVRLQRLFPGRGTRR